MTTLTLGYLWGPTPFLAAVPWSESPGVLTSPPGPSTLARLPKGSGCSDDLGGSVGGPSALPDWLPETGAHPRLRQEARASGFGPDTSRGARRRSPRAASPASPRKPRECRPTLPAFPDPRSDGAAGTGPATSSGRIRARAGLWAGWESRASAFLLPAWR